MLDTRSLLSLISLVSHSRLLRSRHYRAATVRTFIYLFTSGGPCSARPSLLIFSPSPAPPRSPYNTDLRGSIHVYKPPSLVEAEHHLLILQFSFLFRSRCVSFRPRSLGTRVRVDLLFMSLADTLFPSLSFILSLPPFSWMTPFYLAASTISSHHGQTLGRNLSLARFDCHRNVPPDYADH